MEAVTRRSWGRAMVRIVVPDPTRWTPGVGLDGVEAPRVHFLVSQRGLWRWPCDLLTVVVAQGMSRGK